MTNPGIVDNDELLNSRILTFDINRSDGEWLGLGRSGTSTPFLDPLLCDGLLAQSTYEMNPVQTFYSLTM